MHPSECARAAPDRRIDQTEDPQPRPTGAGIDSHLEHCQERARNATLALHDGDGTSSGAYLHHCEARQQC